MQNKIISNILVLSLVTMGTFTTAQATLEFSGDDNIMRGTLSLERGLEVFDGSITIQNGVLVTNGITLVDGSQLNNRILKSDATGKATWVDIATILPPGGPGGLTDIVQDLSPTLGGDLDVGIFSLISAANADIKITPNGTGDFIVKTNLIFAEGGVANNVGIGTATPDPSAKLDVAGRIKSTGLEVIGTTTTTNLEVTNLTLGGSPFNSTGLFRNGGENGLANRSIGNNDAFDLSLETNDQARLTIKKDTGRVGIGTQNPTVALDVKNGSVIADSIESRTSLTAATIAATGALSAASVTSTGALSAGSIASTGALSAASITSTGALNAGSITTGGALSAASLTTTAFTLNDGSQLPGKILGLDAAGKATWINPPAGGGGIASLFDDKTPRLGGDLRVGASGIISEANADIKITPNGTGDFIVKTNLIFAEGGVANNVGIGTATPDPSAKLDVAGRIKSTGLEVIGTTTTTNLEVTNLTLGGSPFNSTGLFRDGGEAAAANRSLGNTNAFDLSLETNDQARLTIKKDTGRVGIGTQNPSATLDVAGDINATQVMATSIVGTNITANSLNTTFDVTSSSGSFTANTGSFTTNFGNISAPNGSISARTMVIDGQAFTPASFIKAGGDTAGASRVIGTNDNFAFAIETNNAERLTIAPSGNVGIGAAPGAAKLVVGGDIQITGGSPAVGRVLTSNALGVAVWADPVVATSTAQKYLSSASATITSLADSLTINTTVAGKKVTLAKISNYNPEISFDFNSLSSGNGLILRTNGPAIELDRKKSGNPEVLIPGTNLKVSAFDGNVLTLKKVNIAGINARATTINMNLFGQF